MVTIMKRVLALVLVFMLMAGSALAAKKARVYSDSMKVYRSASVNSSVKGSLKRGTSFYITDYNSRWAKINYKGYTGYVLLKDIKLDKNSRRKCYAATEAYVFPYVIEGARAIGSIPIGTEVYIAGRNGNYIMCQNKKGTVTVFIHKDDLSWKDPTKDMNYISQDEYYIEISTEIKVEFTVE